MKQQQTDDGKRKRTVLERSGPTPETEKHKKKKKKQKDRAAETKHWQKNQANEEKEKETIKRRRGTEVNDKCSRWTYTN